MVRLCKTATGNGDRSGNRNGNTSGKIQLYLTPGSEEITPSTDKLNERHLDGAAQKGRIAVDIEIIDQDNSRLLSGLRTSIVSGTLEASPLAFSGTDDGATICVS
jgi:hypothetical protein